jgi:hypothetical protein
MDYTPLAVGIGLVSGLGSYLLARYLSRRRREDKARREQAERLARSSRQVRRAEARRRGTGKQ